jgi:hypothetical protein
MMTEDITLVCGHCGTDAVKHLSWVQVHRDFRCERCGSVSRLDKDWLCLALAGRKPAAVAQSPVSTHRLPPPPDRSA